MTAKLIDRDYAIAVGGEEAIAAAVSTFKRELEEHSLTVNVPAPVAHRLIEDIVRNHGGDFQIVDPPPPPELTLQERLDLYEYELDMFLDAKARSFTFQNRHSLALRAGYPNKWQELGAAFGTWMDECNEMAWAGRQAILGDNSKMPATKELFLAQLPEFQFPAVAPA